jgi:hypothetical protein
MRFCNDSLTELVELEENDDFESFSECALHPLDYNLPDGINLQFAELKFNDADEDGYFDFDDDDGDRLTQKLKAVIKFMAQFL